MTLQLAFVMDPVEKISIAEDTSFVFIEESQRRGHTNWFLEISDLNLEGDVAYGIGRTIRVNRNQAPHFELSQPKRIELNSLDAIFMRKDPPIDVNYFNATYILDHCTKPLMVNRPDSLRNANEKIFTHRFSQFMPKALMTKSHSQINKFLTDVGGRAVIKPLNLSGGSGIFLLSKGDKNVPSLIETATGNQQHFVQLQEYLPAIESGDKRVLFMGGEVMGAVSRVPSSTDLRGNLHVGATAQKATLSEKELNICAALKPVFQELGLHFVGIDIIGEMLTEINVTSPTGIQEINALNGCKLEADFIDYVEKYVN